VNYKSWHTLIEEISPLLTVVKFGSFMIHPPRFLESYINKTL